jgi:two-component system, LuxR family, sensor kinase FixL
MMSDQHQSVMPPTQQETPAERRFRLVVEAAPNAMIMVDATGGIAMLNGQAERMFGYSRSELLGQPVEVLVPQRFRAAHPNRRVAFFSEPTPRPMGAGRDLFGLRKDGSEFSVEIGLNPIETDEGAMVLAAVVDISARKAAEFALRESEQRLRSLAAIVESSEDAIVSMALDGTVTSWNKAAERMFGYSADEIIGQSVFILAAPGREGEMTGILDRIRSGERIEHHETQRRRKDGTVLEISLTESPVYDVDGRLVGASKVSRDITESKRDAAALRDSESRLQELHTELLHVSRLSAMGQMSAMMAHELNQPLTAISNYMEAVKSLLDRGGAVPAERLRTVVERAGDQAVRAGQIIQRMREFVSKGDIEKRIEPLPPLLREARELALLGTRQRGVPIEVADGIPETAVLVDKIQIQQVLLNLLRNAAEAISGQADGQIVVAGAKQGDGTVEISVADNGPGLPKEIRARLFQPFVSTKKTGMGVGLSICHTIVTAHNGRLWAESNSGGGTVFRMTLPGASLDETVDV